tara:strand:+ start:177 stop:548 length:372 start_codon:yes stop_codon:yes gene_type:complete
MKKITLIIAVLLFVSCSSNDEDAISESLFTGTWKFKENQPSWSHLCQGKNYVVFNGNNYKHYWYSDTDNCDEVAYVDDFNFTISSKNTIIDSETKESILGIYGDDILGYQLCFGSDECYNIER